MKSNNRYSFPCEASCRDGTDCLNRGQYKGYCWKHKSSKTEFKVNEWYSMLQIGADSLAAWSIK